LSDEQKMPENEEDQSLADFTSRAIRRNKAGSYEQLLCQHLIKAVDAPPADKIRLISEASMMVPDTPVNKELLEILYSVSLSFTETRVDLRDPADFHGAILWGFPRTDKNFEKFIMPWLPSDDQIYTKSGRNVSETDRIEALPWGGEKFWAESQVLHISGFVKLETRFTVWAMPHAMRMFEQLAKLINPDTYQKVLEQVH
jgi:hypothetical protein